MHKATVVIEPLVPQKAPVLVNTVSAPIDDDDYTVRLAPAPASVPAITDTLAFTSPVADVTAVAPAPVETSPPVVWLSGGCSNSPHTAPSLINFELPATQTEKVEQVSSILPFSAHRFNLKESKATETAAIVESHETSPTATTSTTDSATTTETNESFTDTPTPKPVETSDVMSISVNNAGDKLSYSTTYALSDSRTTGMSPPTQSYAYSPDTSPELSYSQVVRGVAFAGPSSGPTNVHFGADALNAPASYAGPSCSTVVPSYSGAISTPVAYASSE